MILYGTMTETMGDVLEIVCIFESNRLSYISSPLFCDLKSISNWRLGEATMSNVCYEKDLT